MPDWPQDPTPDDLLGTVFGGLTAGSFKSYRYSLGAYARYRGLPDAGAGLRELAGMGPDALQAATEGFAAHQAARRVMKGNVRRSVAVLRAAARRARAAGPDN